jgi:hypothetical protein
MAELTTLEEERHFNETKECALTPAGEKDPYGEA